MADPVYLEEGVSYDPVASAQPDLGAKFTTGQSIAAAWQSARNTSGLSDVSQIVQKYSDYAIAGLQDGLPDSPQFVPGDEATRQFGVTGPTPETTLKWDANETVSTGVAAQARKIMLDKIQNDFVMAHRPQTYTAWGATEGAEFLGNAVDPTNLAFLLMPEAALGKVTALGARLTGSAEAAATAARISSALSDTVIGRMANAGVNNAAAVALMQPIVQAGEEQDHMDYGWAQAGQNILFGGLLGAGLHGIGEGVSALAGGTWRASMRAGIANMDSGDSAALMNADLVRADRSTVINDLTAEGGAAPSEAAIAREMQSRQAEMYDKVAQGRYLSPMPAREPVDGEELPPDEIANMASNGDFSGAAKALEAHVNSLEADPDLNLTDAERKEANAPVKQFDQLKSIIGDFTDCVAQEAA